VLAFMVRVSGRASGLCLMRRVPSTVRAGVPRTCGVPELRATADAEVSPVRWRLADRSDPVACRIFDRHYSRTPRAVGAPNCAPPGRVLVLVTEDARALWISRQQAREACHHAWPGSWECSAFRNEGGGLSSDLIREAVAATRAAWGAPPAEGFLTFVNSSRVRGTNPGYCFLRAGWRRLAERTKKLGLVVLALSPGEFSEPEPAHGSQGILFRR